MKNKIKFAIFLSILASSALMAQEDLPAEKVFIHTEQPFYASGDEIRFSTFLMSYQTYALSKVSEEVNVILWNQDLEKILEQKISIENGLGDGVISLPPTLPTGDYVLMGYTNWMMNFKEQSYNTLPLKIFNANDYPLKPDTRSKEPSVTFYPEGGNLVSNRINKIVFKLSEKQQGFSGVIVSEQGDSVATLKPYDDYYGTVSFLMRENINYLAKINLGGKEKTIALGKGKRNTGSLLVTKNTPQNFIIGINTGDDWFGDTVKLLIQSKGEIVAGFDREIKTPIEYFAVPKKLLKSGLNQINLLDKENKVVSERLIYNRASQNDSLSIKVTRQERRRRQQISLTLDGVDNTHLSSAVVKANYFKNSSINQIDYGVNLFSEIDFFPPGTEFIQQLEDDAFLDMFLISQNLKTFRLKGSDDNVEDNPTYHEPSKRNSIVLQGKVLDRITEKAVTDTSMFVSISCATSSYLQIVDVDEKGEFRLEVQDVYGATDLIFKLNGVGEEDNNIKYEIFNNSPVPKPEDFSYVAQVDVEEVNSYLQFVKERRVINNVYFPDNIQVGDSVQYRKGFFGNYYSTLDYSEYIVLDDFAEIAKELVPAIDIDGGRIYLQGENEATGYLLKRYESEPLVLIDGLPVFDTKRALKLLPEEIKYIRVINNRYFLNGRVFDGILEITTKKSNYFDTNKTNHYVHHLTGFQVDSTPDDSLQNEIAGSSKDKLPFFESTLYWNPSLDASNTIRFAVPDGTKDFMIEIQGTDGEGNFTYHKKVVSLEED